MKQIESRVVDWISLRDRSLLSDSEFTNDFLILAADAPDVSQVMAALILVPEEIRQLIWVRFEELQSGNSNWCPVAIGPGFTNEEAANIREQLRQLYSKIQTSF